MIANHDPAYEKEKTDSGIILSNTGQQTLTGKVIKIGDKVKHIKEGDKVRYYEHSGVKLNYENEDYLLLSEKQDVIAIFEKEFVFPDDLDNL